MSRRPKLYRFALPAGATGLAGVVAAGLAAGVVAALLGVAAFVFAAGFGPAAFALALDTAGVGVVTLPAWFALLAAVAAGAGRAPLSSLGLSTTCLAR